MSQVKTSFLAESLYHTHVQLCVMYALSQMFMLRVDLGRSLTGSRLDRILWAEIPNAYLALP